MKFGIVVFPGSNCDADCYHVLQNVMEQDARYIWHKETGFSGLDAIVVPGGFSYGDYLRTGAIARFSPVMPAVMDFASNGGLVIGICNGFQILLEAGLLPGAMLRNRTLQFICRRVFLKVKNNQTPFTNQLQENQVIKVPIAHGEGNYYCDDTTLAELHRNQQVVFTYCSPEGEETDPFNPNGSRDNIAGIMNKDGNILGMMPHPERCSEAIMGGQDGFAVFASMMNWLKEVGR